jgi:hypothetical protein
MFGVASRAVVESMTSSMDPSVRRDAYAEVAAAILALVISITVIAFAGQWLWNNVVVELFSIAKPSRSIWMLIGLKFFVLLLAP